MTPNARCGSLLAFGVILCVACGTSTTVVAGSTHDATADSSTDGATGCTSGTISMTGTLSSCDLTVKWVCTANSSPYKTVCHCPSAMCECLKDGIVIKTVSYTHCPGCGDTGIGTLPHDEDKLCGFP